MWVVRKAGCPSNRLLIFSSVVSSFSLACNVDFTASAFSSFIPTARSPILDTNVLSCSIYCRIPTHSPICPPQRSCVDLSILLRTQGQRQGPPSELSPPIHPRRTYEISDQSRLLDLSETLGTR